jgi:hypothetical protein
VSRQVQGGGLDAGLAVETAVSAVRVAIRTAALTGEGVPDWAGTVAGLLEGWSEQFGPGGVAGRAGTARMPGALDAPSRKGVLASAVVPAAPPPTRPLLGWARLCFGVRRCLACGRIGRGSLEPAGLMVPPRVARTWRCVDRLACRTRRLQRGDWW